MWVTDEFIYDWVGNLHIVFRCYLINTKQLHNNA